MYLTVNRTEYRLSVVLGKCVTHWVSTGDKVEVVSLCIL